VPEMNQPVVERPVGVWHDFKGEGIQWSKREDNQNRPGSLLAIVRWLKDSNVWLSYLHINTSCADQLMLLRYLPTKEEAIQVADGAWNELMRRKALYLQAAASKETGADHGRQCLS